MTPVRPHEPLGSALQGDLPRLLGSPRQDPFLSFFAWDLTTLLTPRDCPRVDFPEGF